MEKLWLKAMELCVPARTLSGLSLSGPELFSNMSLITRSTNWWSVNENHSRNYFRCYFIQCIP